MIKVKQSIFLVLMAGLAGCATLPSNGPTSGQIQKSALDPKDGTAPIRVVHLSTIGDLPEADAIAAPAALLAARMPPPTDMVGPGDVLEINVYEAGVTLFAASGGSAAAAGQAGTVPGVQVQKLPLARVDDGGDIVIPYAGSLHVAGHTIGEVEAMIRHSLRRMSQNPQVMVTMDHAITNTVIVGGEVTKPGRLVLETNRESLSDVVALAGGYRGNVKDLLLRISRGGSNIDLRMNDLLEKPDLDVPAYPGDRIMLINNPRTYSVLGAAGRVDQIPFDRSTVSLAEAIATAGGVNSAIGNPAAIFVFRYIRDPQGNDIPMVYHLNLMNAGAYFLSQRFFMQDKDVLYVGNAAANQPGKLVQLISQLFSPILTVTSAVQTVQRN